MHSKLFRSRLRRPVATGYQIAYLLGIEAVHLPTTIYGVKDFPGRRTLPLVSSAKVAMVLLEAIYVDRAGQPRM